MQDLISRQAAIEALAKFVPYAICDESTESYTNGLTDAYNLICQLPSVQPEQIARDIATIIENEKDMRVASKNAEHTETHACDYERTETHDLVSRRSALEAMDTWDKFGCGPDGKLVRYDDDKHYVPYVLYEDMVHAIKHLPSVQPEHLVKESGNLVKGLVNDCISRKAAIDAVLHNQEVYSHNFGDDPIDKYTIAIIDNDAQTIAQLPSVQPEQRYTEEELMVFQHGISLSLLSKRSAQHWRYDENTATEIKFLERLYEKVGADMRGTE